MGLDMYAARRLYVKQWEHEKPDERYTVQIAYGGKPVPGIQSDRISAVEEELMTWCKAYHIHGWFVDNVQGGIDDCGQYPVDDNQLQDLRKRCEKVLAASKLTDGMVWDRTSYSQEHPRGLVHRTPGKVIEDTTVAERVLPLRLDLPCVSLGEWEYDERYLTQVSATLSWVNRTLADNKAGVPGEVCYSSSW